MPERKRRDDLAQSNIDFENELLKDESVELGAGCSITLDYTKETPTLYVKTYGEVDVFSLRKKLEQHYPGAKIEGLTHNTPVHVDTRKKTKPKAKKPKK